MQKSDHSRPTLEWLP